MRNLLNLIHSNALAALSLLGGRGILVAVDPLSIKRKPIRNGIVMDAELDIQYEESELEMQHLLRMHSEE